MYENKARKIQCLKYTLWGTGYRLASYS